MPKGFASYLFILGIVSILVLNAQLGLILIPFSHFELRRIHTHPLLLENAADKIIEEKLREGLLLHEEPEAVRARINSTLISFLNAYEAQTTNAHEPIVFENGFFKLEGTNYFSLFSDETVSAPLALEHLNRNSHVLILPLPQNARYGEYTYTGGTRGNEILATKIRARENKTLFAIPSGYLVCVFGPTGEVPCAP